MAMPSYGPEVMQRYRHPQHVGSLDVDAPHVGTAIVGSPAVGQVLKLQVRVQEGRIDQACFRAYGCGALIAVGAWLCERLAGQTLDQAKALDSQDIMGALQLPAEKLHCALLALDAVAAVVVDYTSKHAV